MSDQYERVSGWTATDGRYDVDPIGAWKLVPFDAIVIERGELPTVVADKHVISGSLAFRADADAVDVRRQGLAYLAAAEHLAAHPPVDEAQVEALFHDLAVRFTPNDDLRDFARRMVTEGWSKPGPTS